MRAIPLVITVTISAMSWSVSGETKQDNSFTIKMATDKKNKKKHNRNLI
jgi:hypothetical protein